jgi:hypothetical protein
MLLVTEISVWMAAQIVHSCLHPWWPAVTCLVQPRSAACRAYPCVFPVQVCQDSIAEARRDADGLSARHSQLRRRVRQLYSGYRGLRYRVEDEWPQGTGRHCNCDGARPFCCPPAAARPDISIGWAWHQAVQPPRGSKKRRSTEAVL